MPVLNVSAGALPDISALRPHLGSAGKRPPIIIMVHGFRYNPARPATDPRHLVYATHPVDRRGGRTISWPRHIGLTGPDHALAIGFGWQGSGTIWGAYGRAGRAGQSLAELVRLLNTAAPDRPVRFFAHSLGARVALAAIAALNPGAVDRALFLTPAEFAATARNALRRHGTPDGPGLGPRIVNITGRENALFDALLRMAFPHLGRTLGSGLAGHPGWIDLPLDDADCRARLRRLGIRMRAYRPRICHWSGYRRPGAFSLYRAFLTGQMAPETLALAARNGAPHVAAPDPAALADLTGTPA